MPDRGKGLLLIFAGIIAIGSVLVLRYAKEQLGVSWGGSKAVGDVFVGFAIVAFAILYYTWPIAVFLGLIGVAGARPWAVARALVIVHTICVAVIGIGMEGVAWTSSSANAGLIFGGITIAGLAALIGMTRQLS